MSLRFSAISVALGLVLAGCGGHPSGLMRPVASAAPDATTVPLLLATTRRAARDDPGELFTGERSRRVSYGRLDVSIPASHAVGAIEWPDRAPGDPGRSFVVTRAEAFDREAFRRALRERLASTGERSVVVFVHGFNNRFDETVFRFAQIMKDSGTHGVPVLFTWPSRGRLLAYPYDRESATYSRVALEQVLSDIVAEPRVKDAAVLAHSMGNWVALEALRQQAIRAGRVSPKISNVMLAAPDVDIDVARTQLLDLGPQHPRITLFVSQDDRALAASEIFWGGSARLGAIDPDAEPYRTALERASINVVDLTKLNSGDSLNHGKFASAPAVVQSIGARLAAGQTIDKEVGVGGAVGAVVLGTVRTVGATATAAVAAPLAIVDPDTRDDLGEHLRSVLPHGTNPADIADD